MAKLPARRPDLLPSVLREIGTPAERPTGNHWFGFQRNVIARNTRVVDADIAYLEARRRQGDAYVALIDARFRIAQKIAELIDLPNRINDEQRAREHARHLAERKRELERLQAAYERAFAIARNDVELARLHEGGVGASRNLEAAQRVKDVEIDSWYSQAQARRNNSQAERDDTLADLQRMTAGPAEAHSLGRQRSSDLAVLDHQIELERQRGNEAAVLALLNLRARLQAAS